jgi:hypothetical protein
VEAGGFFSNLSNSLIKLCGITSQKIIILFMHFLSLHGAVLSAEFQPVALHSAQAVFKLNEF